MEKKNKSGIIIGILIGIIIILTTLVILFATDTISFKNNKDNNNENNSETSNNENNNIQEENNNQTNITNNGIDTDTLNYLLKGLGIPTNSTDYGNSKLSYYVSKSDYKKYARAIIIASAVNGDGNIDGVELPDNYNKYEDKGACEDAIGCAIISEEKAHEILRLYNFGGYLTDYFHKSSVLDKMYGIHFGGTLVIGEFNGPDAGINHTVTSELIDGIIKITDEQEITYYDVDNSNKLTNKKQTVIFSFIEGLNTGEYFLSNVEVKQN